VEALEEQ
jgi:hypothetical protein